MLMPASQAIARPGLYAYACFAGYRKGSEMSCTYKKVIGILLAVFLLVAPVSYAQQSDSAGAALREGRRLLKRGQADKALVQLRNALNLYTAAKNNSGMAATYNELGDLYMRQGQYQIALENYQKALDGFFAADTNKQAVNTAAASAIAPVAGAAAAGAAAAVADDKYNANLMLAKIGDVNFRLGKTAEAKAA
jgi:tetratricopeptide (TPR) repeat protein